MYGLAQMLHAFMFVKRHWRLRCLLLPRWGTGPARDMGISTAKIWARKSKYQTPWIIPHGAALLSLSGRGGQQTDMLGCSCHHSTRLMICETHTSSAAASGGAPWRGPM